MLGFRNLHIEAISEVDKKILGAKLAVRSILACMHNQNNVLRTAQPPVTRPYSTRNDCDGGALLALCSRRSKPRILQPQRSCEGAS